MNLSFDEIFTRLMLHEGGYVNNPKDPGLATKYGISKRSYPQVNIEELTQEAAKAIYYRDFWTPLNGDKLFDGVGFQLFDMAVNSGIGNAIRTYQKALGVVDDGHFGPASLAAASAMSESDQIMRIVAERLKFMVKCSAWNTFSKGWVNRMAANLYYGAQDS